MVVFITLHFDFDRNIFKLHACMHQLAYACMHAVHMSPAHTCCRPVQRLYLSGKRRMVILYELSSLKTPDKCVLRDQYGAEILKVVLGHMR